MARKPDVPDSDRKNAVKDPAVEKKPRKKRAVALLDPKTGKAKPAKPKVEKKPAAKPAAPKRKAAKPKSKKKPGPKPKRKKKPVRQKPTKKKMPQRRAAEIQKDIELIRKKNKILDLKANGATVRQISELLEKQGETGIKPTRVQELLNEALDDLHRNHQLKTKHAVVLELEKLERHELALAPNLQRLAELDKSLLKQLIDGISAGDGVVLVALIKNGFHSDDIEKYSRSIERIWKRRDSLLGLHKPVKVQVDARDALAKLLGKAPEDLPSGDVES